MLHIFFSYESFAIEKKIINEVDILKKKQFFEIADKLNIKYQRNENQFLIPVENYNNFVRKLVSINALKENYLSATIPEFLFLKEKIIFLKELQLQMRILEIPNIYKALVYLQNNEVTSNVYINLNEDDKIIPIQKKEISYICNSILSKPNITIIPTQKDFYKSKLNRQKQTKIVSLGTPFGRIDKLNNAVNLLNKIGIPHTIKLKKINLPNQTKIKEFWEVYVNENDYNKARLKLIANGLMPENPILNLCNCQEMTYKALEQYKNKIDFEYKLLLNILQLDFIYECDLAVKYLPEKQVDVYLDIIHADEIQLIKNKKIIKAKTNSFLKKYHLTVKKIIFLTGNDNS